MPGPKLKPYNDLAQRYSGREFFFGEYMREHNVPFPGTDDTVRNVFGISGARSGLSAAVTSVMLGQGHSLADILDDTKLAAERKAAAEEVLNRYRSGTEEDRTWFCNVYVEGCKRLTAFLDEKAPPLVGAEPEAFLEGDNKYVPLAATISHDIMQEMMRFEDVYDKTHGQGAAEELKTKRGNAAAAPDCIVILIDDVNDSLNAITKNTCRTKRNSALGRYMGYKTVMPLYQELLAQNPDTKLSDIPFFDLEMMNRSIITGFGSSNALKELNGIVNDSNWPVYRDALLDGTLPEKLGAELIPPEQGGGLYSVKLKNKERWLQENPAFGMPTEAELTTRAHLRQQKAEILQGAAQVAEALQSEDGLADPEGAIANVLAEYIVVRNLERESAQRRLPADQAAIVESLYDHKELNRVKESALFRMMVHNSVTPAEFRTYVVNGVPDEKALDKLVTRFNNQEAEEKFNRAATEQKRRDAEFQLRSTLRQIAPVKELYDAAHAHMASYTSKEFFFGGYQEKYHAKFPVETTNAPNRFGLNASRSALNTAVISLMLRNGKTLEDILDPNKLKEERTEAAKEVSDHYISGKEDDRKWFAEVYYQGTRHAIDYLDRRAPALFDKPITTLMQPENRTVLFADAWLTDVCQEMGALTNDVDAAHGAGAFDRIKRQKELAQGSMEGSMSVLLGIEKLLNPGNFSSLASSGSEVMTALVQQQNCIRHLKETLAANPGKKISELTAGEQYTYENVCVPTTISRNPIANRMEKLFTLRNLGAVINGTLDGSLTSKLDLRLTPVGNLMETLTTRIDMPGFDSYMKELQGQQIDWNAEKAERDAKAVDPQYREEFDKLNSLYQTLRETRLQQGPTLDDPTPKIEAALADLMGRRAGYNGDFRETAGFRAYFSDMNITKLANICENGKAGLEEEYAKLDRLENAFADSSESMLQSFCTGNWLMTMSGHKPHRFEDQLLKGELRPGPGIPFDVTRNEFSTLVKCYMLQKGHSFDDIMDPFKLYAEKQAAGTMLSEKIRTGGEENESFLGELFYNGCTMLGNYLDRNIRQFAGKTPIELLSPKNRNLFSAITALMDAGQTRDKCKNALLRHHSAQEFEANVSRQAAVCNFFSPLFNIALHASKLDNLDERTRHITTALYDSLTYDETRKYILKKLAKTPNGTFTSLVRTNETAKITSEVYLPGHELDETIFKIQDLAEARGPEKIFDDAVNGKFAERCGLRLNNAEQLVAYDFEACEEYYNRPLPLTPRDKINNTLQEDIKALRSAAGRLSPELMEEQINDSFGARKRIIASFCAHRVLAKMVRGTDDVTVQEELVKPENLRKAVSDLERSPRMNDFINEKCSEQEFKRIAVGGQNALDGLYRSFLEFFRTPAPRREAQGNPIQPQQPVVGNVR